MADSELQPPLLTPGDTKVLLTTPWQRSGKGFLWRGTCSQLDQYKLLKPKI